MGRGSTYCRRQATGAATMTSAAAVLLGHVTDR